MEKGKGQRQRETERQRDRELQSESPIQYSPSSHRTVSQMIDRSRNYRSNFHMFMCFVTEHPVFERTILIVIIVNAITIAVETNFQDFDQDLDVFGAT